MTPRVLVLLSVIFPAGILAEEHNSFRDCTDCPELVVIASGSFTMGDLNPPEVYEKSAGDPRYPYSRKYELPVHKITFSKPFAIGKYEVTKGQFAQFVEATGFEPALGCLGRLNGKEGFHETLSWRAPGFPQTDNHSVVCVNRYDAEEYMAWLSGKTGQRYRFPSEAEWEYVARAGTRDAYPWGDEPGVGKANCKGCGTEWDDKSTSPAGSFASNAWGVYDMAGNVWEPLLDCFEPGYEGAPADGSARETAGCERRGLRGGSWYDKVAAMRSSMRGRGTPTNRIGDLGFRVVREIE
jgi:formylglycine-generating enzyme required for sulfatase activity